MDEASGPTLDASSRRPRVSARTWILLALVATLVYAGLALLSDLRELGANVVHIPLSTYAAALGLVLVGYAVRGARWHAMVAPESPHPSRLDSMLAFLAGFSMAVTPGKVGEVVKAYYQWERDGTPVSVSLGATVAERGFDVLVLVLLASLGLALLPIGSLWAFVAVLGLVVAGFLILSHPSSLAFTLRLADRWPRLGRFTEGLRRGQSTLRRCLRPGRSLPFLAMGVLAWSLEPIAMMMFSHGLGAPLPFTVCAFVFAAGSLLSVASLIPGGLGVFEGGTIVGLTTLTGMPLAKATTLILVLRLSTLWFGMLLGLASIALLRALPRRGVGAADPLPQPP